MGGRSYIDSGISSACAINCHRIRNIYSVQSLEYHLPTAFLVPRLDEEVGKDDPRVGRLAKPEPFVRPAKTLE